MACVYWHPLQLFHCLAPSTSTALLDRSRNCEVGCYPCEDSANFSAPFSSLEDNIGVSNRGTRWLRPSKVQESRDAWGRFHFMSANEPWLLAPGAMYEMALCYEQYGRELWNKRLCDCHSYNHCAQGAPWHQPVLFTPIPTCAWAFGAGWTPSPATYPRCTSDSDTHGMSPIKVPFAGDGLWLESDSLSPAFVRHWIPPTQSPAGLPDDVHAGEYAARRSWCAGNMMVLCAGHVPGYQHPLCNANGLSEYYLDLNYSTQPWHLWDYARVMAFDGAFRVRSDLMQDAGVIAAKNAALAYVASNVVELGLEQLSNPRRTASPFENWNAELNRFSAIYDAGIEDDDPPGPVVHEFPNSFLRRGRQRVSAEYRITRATLELEVIPYRIRDVGLPENNGNDPATDEQLNATFPYVRAKLELHMGTTATMLDPFAGTVEGGGHSGSERSQRFPTVFPADDIVYVDASGRTVIPPTRVLWMGNLGAFSDPVHQDVYSHEWDDRCATGLAIGGLRPCCAIAHGLRELVVPGWPTDIDSRPTDRAGLWSGTLKVQFPNFNLFCRPSVGGGVPCIEAI